MGGADEQKIISEALELFAAGVTRPGELWTRCAEDKSAKSRGAWIKAFGRAKEARQREHRMGVEDVAPINANPDRNALGQFRQQTPATRKLKAGLRKEAAKADGSLAAQLDELHKKASLTRAATASNHNKLLLLEREVRERANGAASSKGAQP